MDYGTILSKYGAKYAPNVYNSGLQGEAQATAADQWGKEFGLKERAQADQSNLVKQQAQQFAEEMGFKKDQAAQLADQWAKTFGESSRQFDETNSRQTQSQTLSEIMQALQALTTAPPQNITGQNGNDYQILLSQLMGMLRG